MASLQVRDLPEPIYRKLQDEARNEHRSLAQQAVAVMEKGLGIYGKPRERRQRVLQRIKQRPVCNTENLTNPVKHVREDRKR